MQIEFSSVTISDFDQFPKLNVVWMCIWLHCLHMLSSPLISLKTTPWTRQFLSFRPWWSFLMVANDFRSLRTLSLKALQLSRPSWPNLGAIQRSPFCLMASGHQGALVESTNKTLSVWTDFGPLILMENGQGQLGRAIFEMPLDYDFFCRSKSKVFSRSFAAGFASNTLKFKV